MEDYQRKLLNEYETVRPVLAGEHSVPFDDLERLDEFTGTTHRNFVFKSAANQKHPYRMRSQFSKPCEAVVQRISDDLLRAT